MLAVVIGNGNTSRVETRPDDQSFATGGIDDAMQGGCFEGSGPVVGYGKARAPGASAVGAAFEADGAFAVSAWVDAEDGLTVLEEHRGGVAEVLAGLAIHDDLAVGIGGEVEESGGACENR